MCHLRFEIRDFRIVKAEWVFEFDDPILERGTPYVAHPSVELPVRHNNPILV